MPVDDLVAWAAERDQDGSPRAKKVVSPLEEYRTQSFKVPRSPVRRPQSPRPACKQLPRWFDIGHCAAACSGRCVLHAAKQEEQDVTKDGNTSLPEVAESFRTYQRSHRRHKHNSQDLRLGSTSNPKCRSSRLDMAREALVNGNVALARAIVAEEMERLKI